MTDDRPCFAYGAVLCADTLGARLRVRGLDASHARLLGPAWLPDHALAFARRPGSRDAGVPDVRPLRGSVVQGALLALSPAGRAALDDEEGVAGTVVPADVHVAPDAGRDVHAPPSEACLRAVEAGYAAWGHDPAPLRRAAAGGSGASWVDAVFVYGTLLRGESNAHVLHDRPVRRVREARVRGALLETGQPYPVMVLDAGSTVHGELVELDDVGSRLGPLDALEEFDGYGRPGRLYHRTLVDAATDDGARRAWTYVAGETVGRGARIASGSWRVHRGSAAPG